MGSLNKAPSWADQWGGGGETQEVEEERGAEGKGKKMDKAKAAATAGLDKAKSAASVGAKKVKSGTSLGISWVKAQYQKRSSSNK